MMSSLSRTALALLISPIGQCVVHQRNHKPGIKNPGGIGLFGGRCKFHECGSQAVCRELNEELMLGVDPEELIGLGRYLKQMPRDDENAVMLVHLLYDVELEIEKPLEGDGILHLWPDELIENPKATRIVRLTVRNYLKVNTRFDYHAIQSWRGGSRAL
jgi:8-oxo-dGTP pyrophosphatase MutT (NUDIX family)